MAQVQIIQSVRSVDARGWFTETYARSTLSRQGINSEFVQDNHSLSHARFTLRGLHFQISPRGQDKLVRCIRGRIFDVAVDIRPRSPRHGRWVSAELSAENGTQMFVPIGFAHGFLTLEPETEVLYKCSDTYVPDHERGVRWNDPALGIRWPIPAGLSPILSDKDARQPLLADCDGVSLCDADQPTLRD